MDPQRPSRHRENHSDTTLRGQNRLFNGSVITVLLFLFLHRPRNKIQKSKPPLCAFPI